MLLLYFHLQIFRDLISVWNGLSWCNIRTAEAFLVTFLFRYNHNTGFMWPESQGEDNFLVITRLKVYLMEYWICDMTWFCAIEQTHYQLGHCKLSMKCIFLSEPLFLYLENYAKIESEVMDLKTHAKSELSSQGFTDDSIHYEIFLHMRYKGTDCALMCTVKRELTSEQDYQAFLQTFLDK